MTAQTKHYAQSSAVQPPVTADADGAALIAPDQGGTRRTQNNSNHLPSRWLTQLLDQRLMELYASHELSFAQIAWRLNDEFSMHMSRNAVIGRAHRMHLPKQKRADFKQLGRPVKFPAPKSSVAKPIKTKPAPKPAPAEPRNLPFIKLKDHDCRFATVGKVAPYLFCAQPTVHGSSWCITHFRIVHNDVRLP